MRIAHVLWGRTRRGGVFGLWKLGCEAELQDVRPVNAEHRGEVASLNRPRRGAR
jgi:hypothetical protein